MPRLSGIEGCLFAMSRFGQDRLGQDAVVPAVCKYLAREPATASGVITRSAPWRLRRSAHQSPEAASSDIRPASFFILECAART